MIGHYCKTIHYHYALVYTNNTNIKYQTLVRDSGVHISIHLIYCCILKKERKKKELAKCNTKTSLN